jgi:hypothetical protein
MFGRIHLTIAKTLPALLFITLLVTLFDAPSHALSIGMYGTGGIARQTWSKKNANVFNGGAGFMLDTAVANDTLFNYRFSIGLEQNFDFRHVKKPVPCSVFIGTINDGTTDHDVYVTENIYYRSKESIRPLTISVAHAFGFGVFRNNLLRVWLGPEIALSFMTGGARRLIGGHVSGGLILGLNINLSELISLSVTGSSRVGYAYRSSHYTRYEISLLDLSPPLSGPSSNPFDVLSLLSPPVSKSSERPEDDGLRFSGQLVVAILFRINDSYRLATKPGDITIKSL